MSVSKDCALTLNQKPGHRPMASGQSFDVKKPFLVDSYSVSGLSYLRDHRVDEKIIYPAAGFSMAGIAVHQALSGAADQRQAFALEDLKFRHTLTLSRRDPTVLRLSYQPDRSEFSIHSGGCDDTGAARQLAIGRLTAAKPAISAAKIDLDRLSTRCCNSVETDDFYQRLGQSGLDYGPFFKRITSARVSRHTGEAVTRLSSHPSLDAFRDPWAQPITLLDSAFQSLAVALDTDKHHLYMPTRIRALRVYAEFEPELWCYTRLVKSTNRAVVGDITLFNTQGSPIIDIRGLLCMRIPRSHVKCCNSNSEWQSSPTLRKDISHQQIAPAIFRD